MFCPCSILGVLWCRVFILRYLNHLEFIFVCDMREYPKFIDLTVADFQHHLFPGFPIPLVKETVFSPEVCPCLLCYVLIDHNCVRLFLGCPFCSIDPYVCFWERFTFSVQFSRSEICTLLVLSIITAFESSSTALEGKLIQVWSEVCIVIFKSYPIQLLLFLRSFLSL